MPLEHQRQTAVQHHYPQEPQLEEPVGAAAVVPAVGLVQVVVEPEQLEQPAEVVVAVVQPAEVPLAEG